MGPCPGRVVSTWDGGRRWYSVGSEIGFSDRGTVRVGECTFSEVAGRGKLLFHHDFGDTLFVSKAGHPRGRFRANRSKTSWAVEVCAAPPDNAGIRSVVATRLSQGRFDGALRPVPGGVVAVVQQGPLASPRVKEVAFFRYGSFSSVPLPNPSAASGWMPDSARVHVAWPTVYVLAVPVGGKRRPSNERRPCYGDPGTVEARGRSDAVMVVMSRRPRHACLGRQGVPLRARRCREGPSPAFATAVGSSSASDSSNDRRGCWPSPVRTGARRSSRASPTGRMSPSRACVQAACGRCGGPTTAVRPGASSGAAKALHGCPSPRVRPRRRLVDVFLARTLWSSS